MKPWVYVDIIVMPKLAYQFQVMLSVHKKKVEKKNDEIKPLGSYRICKT